jgi:DNA polymerase I-like protein with 3'-5' exonuclease and polymerase domains
MYKKEVADIEVYYIGNSDIFDSDEFTIGTLQDCYDYCKDKKVLSIDIETTKKYNKYGDQEGLSPYLSKIVMFQIGDLERQYVIDHRIIDITMLLPLLTSKDIIKVGHNIKFEYLHILHNYNCRLVNVYDTQICDQILYNGFDIEFNLNALNKRYLKKEVDKSTRLNFLTIGSRPFSSKEIIYGAEDILHPLLIREKQASRLSNENLINCFNLEMEFLPVLGDIEYKGITFNSSKWLENYNENLKALQIAEYDLNTIVLNRYFDTKFIDKQLSLFSEEFNCSIQWTSSQQVIEFFKYLEICPQEISKTTKKLSYTVNAKVIKASLFTMNKDVSEDIKELIHKYIEFKELGQACSTFGKMFLKHINPITNRIHSSYWQILNTGRISSSNPNLQNIPAGSGFRRCFDVKEGWKIINADYSGQETVILANESGEENIIDLINTGGDMHAFVTKALDPTLAHLTDDEIKKDHKEARQIAKAAGFAINYGGTGHTISKNLGISLKEGEDAYNAYFKAFPQLRKFFDRTIQESMSKGYIEIDKLTNRKFYFQDFNRLKKLKDSDWAEYSKLKGKYERACLNYIIQGAAGSVTKLAAIYFRRWILNNNLENDIFITNLIHDEINVECIDKYTDMASKALERSMTDSGDRWCKIVPLKAAAVIGEHWGH